MPQTFACEPGTGVERQAWRRMSHHPCPSEAQHPADRWTQTVNTGQTRGSNTSVPQSTICARIPEQLTEKAVSRPYLTHQTYQRQNDQRPWDQHFNGKALDTPTLKTHRPAFYPPTNSDTSGSFWGTSRTGPSRIYFCGVPRSPGDCRRYQGLAQPMEILQEMEGLELWGHKRR